MLVFSKHLLERMGLYLERTGGNLVLLSQKMHATRDPTLPWVAAFDLTSKLGALTRDP
jgi:hypothetical protein